MPNESNKKTSKNRAISLLLRLLRYGVAILGIWWIVNQLQWYDHVNLVTDDLDVVSVKVVGDVELNQGGFTIIDPETHARRRVSEEQVVTRADRKHLVLDHNGERKKVEMLGMQLEVDPTAHSAAAAKARRVLVRDPSTSRGQWIDPKEISNGFIVKTPRPALEVGLKSMLQNSNRLLLVASLLVFPLTYILTTYRWLELLKPLGVRLPFFRAFALNMVGCFYSTFLPGSSSGDFVKAYFAAKNTPHKTHVVLSVFIDRVIGLISLVGLGGVLSAYQYFTAPDHNSPTARACMQVAIGATVIYFLMLIGFIVINSSALRRALGLSYLLHRLPMQKQLGKVRDVARTLRANPFVILWTVVITLPVHVTTIVSAMLAGQAFGLPISPGFYFVAVPVLVLVAAVPLTPGGVGVMEFFAVMLTAPQGAMPNDGIVLAMSIRAVQMLWNLTGGLIVLRGGFTPPHNEAQIEAEIARGDVDQEAAV